VTDTVDNGGTCAVTGGTSISIPAGGSKTLSYSCTWVSQPSSYNGTNTATATWDASANYTPTGSASGTANFAFDTGAAGNPTNINKTVTVTDTFNGGSPVTLGTLTAVTTTPYTTKTYTYTQTVPVPAAGCKSYGNTARIVETGQTFSVTVQVCKPSLVTNSSLCTFDVDGNAANGNQFRLIYTPDPLSQATYKLNASNPGQYYYNVLHYNPPGPTGDTVTMNIPFPFVTHGATPIHVYSSVTIKPRDGQACLNPGTEVANQQDQITFANYGNNPVLGTTQTSITVPVPEGFSYVNIHLDYGLKQTTGYAKIIDGTMNNAMQTIDPGPLRPNIPDMQNYTFSNGGTHVVQSINSFKRNPGVGGLLRTDEELAIPGQTLILKNSTGAPVAVPAYTDDDGWYFISYKHTGKAALFTVLWQETGQTKTILLKSNSMVQTDFP